MMNLAYIEVTGQLLLERLKGPTPETNLPGDAAYHHAIFEERSGVLLLFMTSEQFLAVPEGCPIPRFDLTVQS